MNEYNKIETDYRYREQSSGYQWETEEERSKMGGRRLRNTNSYV